MAEIEFITAEVCPFAERTRLLLKEKGIPFTHTEVNLEAKPDWFEAISPYSKVPVLRCGEDLIWESAVINEYIEETHPEPPMLPRDPGRRALARFWIDFCNVKFVVTWYKALLAQEAAAQASLLDQLAEHMVFMERDGIAKLGGGPYWMGEDVGLVDFTFYPWFRRLSVMTHYREFTLPPECARLAAWAEEMGRRESVNSVTHLPEFYIESAAKYASGTASGTTARDMRGA
jgi:glutathione S-transferase